MSLQWLPENNTPSFLVKLLDILNNPENSALISWDSKGLGFHIHDPVCFAREVLPKYFRHSNFNSFVRQLNMYDFHKSKKQNKAIVFKNPYFQRDALQTIGKIRRKVSGGSETTPLQLHHLKKQRTADTNSSPIHYRQESFHPPVVSCPVLPQNTQSEAKQQFQKHIKQSAKNFQKCLHRMDQLLVTENQLIAVKQKLTNYLQQGTGECLSLLDSIYEVKTQCAALMSAYQNVWTEIEDISTSKKMEYCLWGSPLGASRLKSAALLL